MFQVLLPNLFDNRQVSVHSPKPLETPESLHRTLVILKNLVFGLSHGGLYILRDHLP